MRILGGVWHDGKGPDYLPGSVGGGGGAVVGWGLGWLWELLKGVRYQYINTRQ